MSKPVANDLDEEEALRAVINALRADNGREAPAQLIPRSFDMLAETISLRDWSWCCHSLVLAAIKEKFPCN